MNFIKNRVNRVYNDACKLLVFKSGSENYSYLKRHVSDTGVQFLSQLKFLFLKITVEEIWIYYFFCRISWLKEQKDVFRREYASWEGMCPS